MTGRRQRCAALVQLCFVGGLVIAAVAGCESEYPEITPGAAVSGRVFYSGTGHAGFVRPAVQVAAFTSFPPSMVPHSSFMFEPTDFTDPAGMEYSLQELEPYRYYVTARVVDMTDQRAITVPSGGYPSFCALSEPEGPVELGEGEQLEGADITIYDNSGGDDPCNATVNVCPAEGRSAMLLTIRTEDTSIAAGEDDGFVAAMFSTWPVTGPPIWFRTISPSQVVFPLTVTENKLAAGSYALYVCLDRGADNLADICEPGDIFAIYNGGDPVEFPADKVVTLDLELDTGISADPVVEDPSVHGCE